MNKALYFREIKMNIKSFLIWTISLILIMFISIFKYNAINETGIDSKEIVSSMPKFLLAMFNMTSLDMTTFIGYYGIVFVLIQLMAVIYAGILGSSMLSKEERDKTSEFLNTKPISRKKIILTKIISSITLLFIFTFILYISSAICIVIEKGDFFNELFQMHLSMFFIQLIFFSIGIVLSVTKKNIKKVSGTTSSAILVFYIIGVMQEMDDKFYNLRYATPFKFFPISDIASGQGLKIRLLSILIIFTIIFIFIGFKKYEHRDL